MFDFKQPKSTSRRAFKSEMAVVKSDGGRRVPMSGAGRAKGDVVTRLFLIEDKYTDAASYRLTAHVLRKTVKEARARWRPQWRVTVLAGTDPLTVRVMLEDDYLYLLNRAGLKDEHA